MTSISRTDLKTGTKFLYGRLKAEVISVRANGITIGYWGLGIQLDQWVTRRVSLKDLAPFSPNHSTLNASSV